MLLEKLKRSANSFHTTQKSTVAIEPSLFIIKFDFQDTARQTICPNMEQPQTINSHSYPIVPTAVTFPNLFSKLLQNCLGRAKFQRNIWGKKHSNRL